MKYIFIYSLFLALFFSCKSKPKSTQASTQTSIPMQAIVDSSMSFSFIDINGHPVTPGKKLIDSWRSFVKAVQANNYEMLENVFADCVFCEVCYAYTEPEDSTKKQYFLFGDFMKTNYEICFNKNLKSRLSDTTKISGHYDDANWEIYTQFCFNKLKQTRHPKIVEFFVTTTDKSKDFTEGGVTALAFMETATGYKFCGYSTIP
jgi:hypothetical protein